MGHIEFSHKPVMFDECIQALSIKPEGIYVDGTAGGGGHSSGIAERLTTGRLIAIDQDAAAIQAAGERLAAFGDRVTLVRDNFRNLDGILKELKIDHIDGILLDLGVSSYQLDTPERGFSYNADAPLDMKMDRRRTLSAYNVVNEYSADKLRRILYDYGEERFAPRIAAAIVARRQQAPIETTGQLVDIIKGAIPAAAREGGHHPAKRSFQAIRIEVNGELDVIEPALRAAVACLRSGGRAAVITFHSLEDRIVKQTFASLAEGCTCPKDFPVCVCGKKPEVRRVNSKPIQPCEQELEQNPRSRSAKLRVVEKI